MSYGNNNIDSKSNFKNASAQPPRWFTKEGKAHLATLRAKHQTTPQEVYYDNRAVVGMYTSNSCGTCSSNTSYAYQSGSAGGSPF